MARQSAILLLVAFRPGRWFRPFFAAPLIFSIASATLAQTASESSGSMGMLYQNNTQVIFENPDRVRPVAFAPTAVANGLTYLENEAAAMSKPDPFTVSPDNYDAVNALAKAMNTTANTVFNPEPPPRYLISGGTTIAGMATGLENYLGEEGANPAPSVFITGQYSPNTPKSWLGNDIDTIGFANTTPTASYLAQALEADDALEIGVQFGNFGGNSALNFNPTGGHELTVWDIDFNPDTGTGTIGFIDPDDRADDDQTGKLTLSDGYLYISYQLYSGQTVFGRIMDDMVESVSTPFAAPDGGMTSCLLAGGLIVLGAMRRRDRRRGGGVR
jgi:hypothetical protein